MPELKRIYWTRTGLRLAYLAVMLWLVSAVLVSLTSNARPDAAPRTFSSSGVGVVREVFSDMFDGVLAAVMAPGLFAVALVVVAAVVNALDIRRRDPVRRFTRQQRREGIARADGRCEMEAGFGRRCSRAAEHGDHFYPWSKGGSTSLQNFVAACARCNRAKGARIPTPGQQGRLERRRRDYLAQESSISVGERQPLP
ncbi:HNH endonuclease [Arthrobacter sp. S13_S34]|nr:HNH endonuclease [Arthrobacter sp. S13_S34]